MTGCIQCKCDMNPVEAITNCVCGKCCRANHKNCCGQRQPRQARPARLPQEDLRSLADELERVQPRESVHDVQLARFLADMLDKPRRDRPLDTATIETAMQLIADMQIHLEEV